MANRVIDLVIIDQDPDSIAVIQQAVSSLPYVNILTSTDSLLYGYELIRQNRPRLVLMDLRDDTQKTLDIVSRVSTYFKETTIFLSGNDPSMETLMACMQAGAREYLKRPLIAEDIVSVIEKHQANLMVDATGDTSGRILTVFSNKGGLGKTTLSVNLALALSEVVQKPVALVDLNLQLGDITTFLDIEPRQTIVDIAKNIGRVDEAYLKSSLAEFEYGNAHIYVLADPIHVEESEEVTAEQINTVLSVLKASFEYVIIDTNASFDAKTITALDIADNILLVSMVNLPSIRSSQRMLGLFDRLGYDKQKIKLILNRYVEDEITVEDVEDTLEHEVFWKVPNNYQVVIAAINRGIPIQAVENSDATYENFLGFARQISGVLDEEEHHPIQAEDKSLLKTIFKKN